MDTNINHKIINRSIVLGYQQVEITFTVVMMILW